MMTMAEASELARELNNHPNYRQYPPCVALDNERGEWFITAGVNYSGFQHWQREERLRTPEAVQRFIARYLDAE